MGLRMRSIAVTEISRIGERSWGFKVSLLQLYLSDCLHESEWVFSTGGTSDMARGHQKFQSQQKNARKQAEIKKSKGHDQKAAAKAALVYTCTVCRTQMPDPKTFKQHFESKHPKSPMPPELVGVEA